MKILRQLLLVSLFLPGVAFAQQTTTQQLTINVASHSVTLGWTAPVSTTVEIVGYKIYRGSTSGGVYELLTPLPIPGTMYVDTQVQSGETYYYVATSAGSDGSESIYSNEVMAVIP